MADNVTANAATSSGSVFATDDIGSVHYPRSKIVWGVDGTATDTSATNPLPTSELPRTSGGLSMSKTVSAGTTNATSVKASAGQVYAIQVFNTNAAARYLKLYNKASAPTVGSDTPVKTITIPGNTAGAGAVMVWAQGLAFGTGIAFALTTGVADSNSTAVAADEIVVNIDYA
jgi:hypothetical protein